MTAVIYKNEVEEALSQMEVILFGKSQELNTWTTVPRRISDVFCEAYYSGLVVEQSTILKRSYKLLQEKGYYYTHEENT
jgi:hypothetical protein